MYEPTITNRSRSIPYFLSLLTLIDLAGWLEKKSPSHKLWQRRWFTFVVGDEGIGGVLDWKKQPTGSSQNSVNLCDFVRMPEVIHSGRPLVVHNGSEIIKLRNRGDDDQNVWEDLIIKGDEAEGEDTFVFEIVVREKRGGDRHIILRSEKIDEMLLWLNGLRLLWRKFNSTLMPKTKGKVKKKVIFTVHEESDDIDENTLPNSGAAVNPMHKSRTFSGDTDVDEVLAELGLEEKATTTPSPPPPPALVIEATTSPHSEPTLNVVEDMNDEEDIDGYLMADGKVKGGCPCTVM